MLGETVGPFRLDAELGVGGMGRVYAATVIRRAAGLHVAPGTQVAIKLVHPHLLEQPGFFKRFLREAQIGRAVDHPNVVRTFDADALVHDGRQHHFLVMEHVAGQTLRELLDELERVPEELCRHIGREVAKGLAAIHAAGVVHRDLKPENVLITPEHVVKVMDLGVARLQDEVARLSQTGAFVGSIHYAAPEQFRKDVEIDHRADIHALGVLLYELSTGRHPFYEDDIRVVMRRVVHDHPARMSMLQPQLTPFFEEVVHTLLAKERGLRFQTGAEVAELLDVGEDHEWWKSRARTLRLETRRPLRRVRVPRETPLYGREAELEKLRSLYERARAGEGQVLLMEGEAGIGKTRLVDEFVGLLRRDGEDLDFLFGSYPPGGAATAAGAFSTAYREHFGEVSLESVLGEYLDSTPILVPAFAALLRGAPPPRGEEALTKDSLQTVFVHATRALARERPVVVLIDDLHFAPDAGRALFAALALAIPEHRVLLIGARRPGIRGEWQSEVQRLDHASELQLARLGPKDLIHLLEDAFRSERLAEQLGGQIALKSDGNPFFAFEIIRGLREGQFITQSEDGSWVSTQAIGQIEIPSSVMDLIEARVSDLDAADRDLLEAAACCGFEFDPSLVAAAIGLDLVPALKRFAAIERTHRLIRSAGRRYAFDHHQVQEALYRGLFEQLREHYHTAIAEALEARCDGAPDGATAVLVCEHFLDGRLGARALPHLRAALDHLAHGYLNEQLIGLADRALGVPELAGKERFEVLMRRARRFEMIGDADEELAALRECLDRAVELDDPALLAEAESSMGWLLQRLARHDEAEEILTRAIAHARAADDRRTESSAEGNMAALMWRTGRAEEEVRHRARHLELSREIGYRRGEAIAVGGMGIRALEDARYDEAHELFTRQLAMAREVGDRGIEAQAVGNQGVVRWRQGRLDEALAHFESDLALSQELGHRRAEALAIGHLGNVHSSLGNHEEARRYMERFLTLARETGNRRAEANAVGNLGSVLFTLGRTAAALEHHARFEMLSEDVGQAGGHAVAVHNQGEVWAVLGCHERARRLADTALALAQSAGIHLLDAHTPWLLGQIAAREGDTAKAEAHLERAAAVAREQGSGEALARVLASWGSLLADAGRDDEARTHLEEALRLAQEGGTPGPAVLSACHLALLPGGDVERARAALAGQSDQLEHVQALEARFLLWRATGDREHLAEAHELLRFLRDHAPPEAHTSVVAGVPLHRAIEDAWMAGSSA